MFQTESQPESCDTSCKPKNFLSNIFGWLTDKAYEADHFSKKVKKQNKKSSVHYIYNFKSWSV